jgi:RNA polymerase sigma-70 factor (ECF subfamily)
MFGFMQSLTLNAIAEQDSESVMADYVIRKNKKALSALYDRYADDLYHYLLTMSEPALAQDIVQQTWLKLVEKPSRYQHASSVKAFLYTIARHALIDEFRKTNRLRSFEESNSLEDDSAAALVVLEEAKQNQTTKDISLAFDEALNKLSFEQREAFCLQQEGFSLEEIAAITYRNRETIKTRLRYAKQNLKSMLEGYRDQA